MPVYILSARGHIPSFKQQKIKFLHTIECTMLFWFQYEKYAWSILGYMFYLEKNIKIRLYEKAIYGHFCSMDVDISLKNFLMYTSTNLQISKN